MKYYAQQWQAKRYIAQQMDLREGVLVLEKDEPGLIEYRVPVSKMRGIVERLKASPLCWSHHWFEHTDHWVAWHYSLGPDREIVIKHIFGGLKCRIQLIDRREYE